MPLSTGQTLNNRYRIVKLLGQGGFGAVYRAWDINLERPVALKENLDASPEGERQFKREAQILVELAHPNLPRVFDSFTVASLGGEGSSAYLVMDFVEGEDLQHKLEQAGGALPEAQALAWIEQVCDALSYLHSQNPPIIHRDIKPANIKIRPDGRAVLVDFGIAKLYEPHMRTTIGARAVTPGYSPQEQYGMGATDVRSDVYALGATLYTLLTGALPPESVQRSVGEALPAPRTLNPAISPHVEAAIVKAMELSPGSRFQSAAELKTALFSSGRGDKAALAGTVVIPYQPPIQPAAVSAAPASAPAPALRQPGKPASRKWLFIAVGVLVCMACVVVWMLLNRLGVAMGEAIAELDTATPAKTQMVESVAQIPTNTPTTIVGSATQPPANVDTGPIKIGVLAPLGGAVPSFGASARDGVLLAIKEWNEKGGVLGRQLEAVVADSQCEADPAVQAANQLIDQQGVRYIVGEVCSKASIPVAEIVNQKHVIQISPTSTNANVTVDKNGQTRPYTFRACFIDPYQGEAMAKFAIGRGYKTAFILHDPDNAYAVGLAEAFESAFVKQGGQIVGKETYASSETDFYALLDQVFDSQAEVLFLPDYYPIVNLVGAQAKEKDVRAVLMGGDGWDSSDLDVQAVEGGFYANHYDPGDTRPIVVDWLERYQAEYAQTPDAIATLSYDAVNMLIAAIQKAGVDDPVKVKDALATLRWEGVSGLTFFDEFHNPIKNVVVIGIQDGEKRFVESVTP